MEDGGDDFWSWWSGEMVGNYLSRLGERGNRSDLTSLTRGSSCVTIYGLQYDTERTQLAGT